MHHQPLTDELMRGNENTQATFYSYVSQEDRIPADHPLRVLRGLVDPVLKNLSGRFNALYAEGGRPSIPPEYLLRALLLQILYTIRSERLLMEQLNYNLLFRWFVGLSMDDAVWDHSVFSKNRDRLLEGDIATRFLQEVVALARSRKLLSDEHFTVDGTLVEAWASQKSFQKKDTPTPGSPDDPGNPTVNFHGEQRTNQTHQSTTDPEARLYRKGPGKESKLSFMGHVVIDNRHALVVGSGYTQATGKAERESAHRMARALRRRCRTGRMTMGADKSYDAREFVTSLKQLGIRPHVAQKDLRGSGVLDRRTTRHKGYQISQRKRKLVEEFFGWMKTIGLLRKTRFKGIERGGWIFTFTAAVYNLIRIRTLQGASP